MKIVILDAYAANPGDLSWEKFEALGHCEVYETTSPEELLVRIKDADAIITNKTRIRAEHLESVPSLRYIGVLATGYNVVDIEAARQKGITVTNIPGYSTDSVAQMVFAHIFNITQQVAHHAQEVRDGRWTHNRDFCFWDTPLIELNGKTLGIVGLGHIGMAVARLGQAFGMSVVAYTSKGQHELPEGITAVSLNKLFAGSDVVSMHCPLTPETRGMVDAARIGQMKESAILINTSRGPLVVEQDLANALNEGKIYAAGLDVLSQEPPAPDNPLLDAKNCFITPHIAWATYEARIRLIEQAYENLLGFLHGEPMHVVS